MRIGCTASRHGVSGEPLERIRERLTTLMGRNEVYELHHGDCVGGDVQIATIARELGYLVIGHPPTNNKFRAFFNSDSELPPAEYIARNHAIVDISEIMLCAPSGSEAEQPRSGTWATIRYARREGKTVEVF